MNKFVNHTGKTVPLFQANIDTDQIIPKQFLKSIERTGFGQYLFFDWRFTSDGSENSEFILNQQQFRNASILLTGKNFGCGSSREHAPWALEDYGFRVVIAPSFADIFYNNCFKIGILPVVLDETLVAKLVENSLLMPEYELTVNLFACEIKDSFGLKVEFAVNEFRRDCLMKGLDHIGLTLEHEARISEFEKHRPNWLSL